MWLCFSKTLNGVFFTTNTQNMRLAPGWRDYLFQRCGRFNLQIVTHHMCRWLNYIDLRRFEADHRFRLPYQIRPELFCCIKALGFTTARLDYLSRYQIVLFPFLLFVNHKVGILFIKMNNYSNYYSKK